MGDLRSPLRFRMDLPADPSSVAAARGLVRLLHHWLEGDQIDRCELVVSEIVTNAIRHGSIGRDDQVVLELDVVPGTVTACVTDRGPAFDLVTGSIAPSEPGGLGLHIARQLSNDLRVEHTTAGNAVRFQI